MFFVFFRHDKFSDAMRLHNSFSIYIEIRIGVYDSCFIDGVIVIIAFIDKFCIVFEAKESVGKSCRYEEQSLILCTQ